MKKAGKLISSIMLLIFTCCLCACGNTTSQDNTSSEKLNQDEKQVEIVGSTSDDASNENEDVTSNNDTDDDTSKHILVVYFSRTGNTKQLAKYAVEYYGADEFEIEAKVPYTDEDIDYGNSDSRTSKEQNDASARPEIANTVENMEQYDTIILAYPIWWGQAPRIINTFMESYDFSGKTIIPFCTSASSGIGSSDTALHELTSSDVNWKDGERFAAGTSKDTLVEWLDQSMQK